MRHPRILFPGMLAVVLALVSSTFVMAQDEKKPAKPADGKQAKSQTGSQSELDRVMEISKLTGRPIFAVAGQST